MRVIGLSAAILAEQANFEEKRDALAARQLALAEQLYPAHPTAFFYANHPGANHQSSD